MLDFAAPDLPPDIVDRLASISATAADQRNAVALLSLIAAGLDPDRFASMPGAAWAALGLDLNPGEWPRVVALLERAGIITGPARRRTRLRHPRPDRGPTLTIADRTRRSQFVTTPLTL